MSESLSVDSSVVEVKQSLNAVFEDLGHLKSTVAEVLKLCHAILDALQSDEDMEFNVDEDDASEVEEDRHALRRVSAGLAHLGAGASPPGAAEFSAGSSSSGDASTRSLPLESLTRPFKTSYRFR